MTADTPTAPSPVGALADSVLLALDTAGRYVDLWRGLLAPGRQRISHRTPRHYVIGVLLLLALPPLMAYQALGLVLDELLFPRYRRVSVRRPLFVLGLPRSGTTSLHHALAADPAHTTFRAWECLFALSVTWRHLWRLVARLDRRVGGPLARASRALERAAFAGVDAVHPTALDAPEEDYLALLPVLGCFILVVPFPDARGPWRLGRFATDVPPARRARLLRFYRRCVQRHLYADGGGRTFLSKNASFAPLAGELLATFPDADVLWCQRPPVAAVSSQLASLAPALRALHGGFDRARFRDRLVERLVFYDRNLHAVLGRHPAAFTVPLATLRRDLAGVVLRRYAALARRLRALLPGTVVIATPGPYGLIAARTARALGARLVFGLHTHYEALSALYWRGLQRYMNHWALTAVNRRLIGGADVVIANSRRMCELAGRLGADDTRLLGTLLPPAFLARVPVSPGDAVGSVLFVGRLAAEKRVGTIIEAAEQLPGLAFHIVGDGPERTSVRSAAARLANLRWTGWLPRTGIINALDRTDLLVLPSAVEAFGTVALEALARGRATLVSRGCGIRDWPGLAPGLHLIGESETSATAIARVAALDPAVRRRRANLGRAGAARLNGESLAAWLDVLDGDVAEEAAISEP